MKTELLEILACPKCQGGLQINSQIEEGMEYLVCDKDQLGFRIEDDIPVLLLEEAKDLSS